MKSLRDPSSLTKSMEGVIPSLLHEMSEKVTVQSLYKGNGVAARNGFSRYPMQKGKVQAALRDEATI
jgi:hypothetical protein